MASIELRLPLPDLYPRAALLQFQQRDTQALAERVDAGRVYKGLCWQRHPACFRLEFAGEEAWMQLAVDAEEIDLNDGFDAFCRRFLGLNQQIAAFEHHYRQHPALAPLLSRQAGLRVMQTATPFEALTWAILGQQVSVQAAVAVRRRLIQAAGVQHSSGLYCYPDAQALAAFQLADFRALGLSQTKAQSLLQVVVQVLDGRLPLDDWLDPVPVEDISRALLAIKGIGPWTLNYCLLRGFGWLDGSLHGDSAVRAMLQTLLQRERPLTPAETQAWLADFAPWRALVAAHLWQSKSLPA